MKKIYKSFVLFFFLIVLGNTTFSQPANIHFGIMGTWGDQSLTDRGMTMSANVQAPIAATISFLFSTAAGNYSPKWCGSTSDYNRNVNMLISGGAFYYTSGGWDLDMTCAVQANYYYTLIVGKNAAGNNDMSILETSYNPVNITSVVQSPTVNISSIESVNVTVTLSGAKNANENVFIRYTNDNWATSNFIQITSFYGGYQGTAVIPAQAAGTTVSYYAFTTTQTAPDAATIDYYTLRLNNNTNSNYSYFVSDVLWCNLQSPQTGTITVGGSYDVYAQVYAPGITSQAGQGTGVSAWIGYSTSDSNPNTWTNWVTATFNTDAGNNDEYIANIGTALPVGNYYYASRFKFGNSSYFYGGYPGGYWDGTSQTSGILTVTPIVGIEENLTHLFEIYPNPARKRITILLDQAQGMLNLSVYNTLGGLVISDVINSSAKSEYSYDISKLSQGVYVVVLKNDNTSFSEKFIIE